MSVLYQPLAKNLRSQLENTVKSARDVAEVAARAALTNLGVGEREAHGHLADDQKALRRRLRAHGRQLGDAKLADDSQEIRHLVWEVAYEQWHRMLFARFLAENHLLMWEPGAPVTLAECAELAQDVSTSLGAKSGWELATILAARMLPQIFKPQSPALAVSFAPEHQRELEKLLSNLQNDVFTASDSLGWVYQFWQAKRKDEVNASEVKIGADELPAVTQLFTEPYMVEFLLHNSLGAWWHTRHPGKPYPVELTYLRTLEDGTPAAGKFEGWPDTLAEFTMLDPCCGSGHFLVAAFMLLVPMRMAAEGLSAKDAVDSVLAGNLHGLELDPRCVEIAVFALALVAWRYPDKAGNPLGVRTEMPTPNIACCGLKVTASPQDWEELVPDNVDSAALLRQELRLLHAAFAQAPLLGSLLDPVGSIKNDLASPSFDTLKELLEKALTSERSNTIWTGLQYQESEDTWELAHRAYGLLEAMRLLAGRYHLVATNVPFLTQSKFSPVLKDYVYSQFPIAKENLATAFVYRMFSLCFESGFLAFVSPQSWWFLKRYGTLRQWLLKEKTIRLLARLGEKSFESPQSNGELIGLSLLGNSKGEYDASFYLVDASVGTTPSNKAELLISNQSVVVQYSEALNKPDYALQANGLTFERIGNIASALQGCITGDTYHFLGKFWEREENLDDWEFLQTTSEMTTTYGGMTDVILWQKERGELAALAAYVKGRNHSAQNWRKGKANWGKKGVVVSQMGVFPATLYNGNIYDNNCCAIVPHVEADVAALWEYCSSKNFGVAIKAINQKRSVEVGTFLNVEFDLAYWKKVAVERFPGGLPLPYSNDPTQWIFHGHPQSSTDPLQVAVTRLLGYTWPAELDDKMELSGEAREWISRCKSLDSHTDDDGIVCLSPVRGEKSAHERLLLLLIDSWETVESGSWKASVLDRLLAEADSSGKGLDIWLRERFFEQHAKRFHHRPFIWHVWDGLKDGFGALVNYHKLDAKNLERLIHTYLGDWIRTQEAGVANATDGASQRLAAAQALKCKLETILEGEAPYDIFVRWKPLAQQPIGWNPDLNDGVRMNIRPFITAEVLRHNKKPKLNITWDKDRGKDVENAPWFHKFHGERINDHHLTLAEKHAARG